MTGKGETCRSMMSYVFSNDTSKILFFKIFWAVTINNGLQSQDLLVEPA
jgi:hypothetical protein